LERIALVDRSILRLATYELLDEPDVPPKVAIDEAIELAKKYSTAQSGAFVNGVLDRIYRDIRAGSRTRTGNWACGRPGGRGTTPRRTQRRSGVGQRARERVQAKGRGRRGGRGSSAGGAGGRGDLAGRRAAG